LNLHLLPLSFAPGEAYQFDWSHEIVVLNGCGSNKSSEQPVFALEERRFRGDVRLSPYRFLAGPRDLYVGRRL